jgi:transcription factor TFIIIB component B''
VERRRRKKAERETQRQAAVQAIRDRDQLNMERAARGEPPLAEGEEEPSQPSAGSAAASASAGPAAAPAPPKPSGVQIRLVDGKLVISEDSLLLSQADVAPSHLDLVYEQQRTVTSASYTNRVKSEQWTAEETKLFYKSLAQYGTDFTFVSQMFPKRTRGQIKSKFKREEKENQHLVDAALKRKLPIGTTTGQAGRGRGSGAVDV